MNWTVKVSSKAEGYYKKLNRKTRDRIREKLMELSESKNPLEHKDVKALTGDLKGFHRLRVGDYRVVFSMLKESKTIAIGNLAPRGNVY